MNDPRMLSILVENLKQNLGMNTSLALSNFIRNKDATFKSNAELINSIRHMTGSEKIK